MKKWIEKHPDFIFKALSNRPFKFFVSIGIPAGLNKLFLAIYVTYNNCKYMQ